MADRIGIFSGTFDPVHRGHIEACVVSLGALSLDNVLIFLEKKPKRKNGVADFMDRANMLELATLDFPSLRIVDLGTDNVTTGDVLKYLDNHFPAAEYWYIVGSDMLDHIEDWPESKKLLQRFNICVVLRTNSEQKKAANRIEKLKKDYKDIKFMTLPSVWSPVSSSTIKDELKQGAVMTGLDPAVHEYIRRHQLYN